MVIAHHILWTAYGCWLPNDPRGSCSLEIRDPILRELGELHQGRRKIQPAGRVIREFHQEAQTYLQFPIQSFDEAERALIADALGQTIWNQGYTCYACAVMPDHVHLLIRRHRQQAEEMISHLQDASRESLIHAGHRRGSHPVWGGPGWKVFLDSADDIRRTVKYIEDNPLRIGLPRQDWEFVKQYDGWCPKGYF